MNELTIHTEHRDQFVDITGEVQQTVADSGIRDGICTVFIPHTTAGIYEYFQHLLIRANIRKSAEPIAECVELMTQMRDVWQELFDSLARQSTVEQPHINPHCKNFLARPK